jgi:hypothetical protein
VSDSGFVRVSDGARTTNTNHGAATDINMANGGSAGAGR